MSKSFDDELKNVPKIIKLKVDTKIIVIDVKHTLKKLWNKVKY